MTYGNNNNKKKPTPSAPPTPSYEYGPPPSLNGDMTALGATTATGISPTMATRKPTQTEIMSTTGQAYALGTFEPFGDAPGAVGVNQEGFMRTPTQSPESAARGRFKATGYGDPFTETVEMKSGSQTYDIGLSTKEAPATTPFGDTHLGPIITMEHELKDIYKKAPPPAPYSVTQDLDNIATQAGTGIQSMGETIEYGTKPTSPGRRQVQTDIQETNLLGGDILRGYSGMTLPEPVPKSGGTTGSGTGKVSPQVFDDMGNVIGTTATTPRPPMTTGMHGRAQTGETRLQRIKREAEEAKWQSAQDTRQGLMNISNVLSPSRHFGSVSTGDAIDPFRVNAPSTFWNTTLTTPRSPATSWYRPETDEFKVGYNPPLWASREEQDMMMTPRYGLGNQSMIPGTSFTEWESQVGGLFGGRAPPGVSSELAKQVAPDIFEPGFFGTTPQTTKK